MELLNYMKNQTIKYKFEKYTILILGDKPATQMIEELESYEISEIKKNLKDFIQEGK